MLSERQRAMLAEMGVIVWKDAGPALDAQAESLAEEHDDLAYSAAEAEAEPPPAVVADVGAGAGAGARRPAPAPPAATSAVVLPAPALASAAAAMDWPELRATSRRNG